jgi:predicted amidohydrolase YtcJ
VIDAVKAAAARGITGLLDFEYADNVADWSRRAVAHELPARVSCSIQKPDLELAIDRGLRTGQILPDGSGLLELGPYKLFVDGSLNTRTALCNEPYPSDPDDFGILATDPDELGRLMARAVQGGIDPAVHAIGDRANSIALDAFSKLGCAGRIEHAQLVSQADLARVAQANLTLGVQPAHATDDRDVADKHWAGRTGRAFAYADLLAAGARLEFGSDAPVSPMDPWHGIAAAVHRTDDDRPPWHPEQAIGLPAALAASSRGRRGVRVGDVADLVIVDHDPATLSPADLRGMPVFGTLLAGRWTYRADTTE